MSPLLKINIQPDKSPLHALNALGGINPKKDSITVNNRYLELNRVPWLPVMGEFHFSRYPSEQWRDELLKMKAGGINVIATYVFWIHIEETKGNIDWNGNNNLRRFIQLCHDLGLYTYLRIGPWAHGECRNGGFPDWVLEECGNNVREDSQPYLSYVDQFYKNIYQQVVGLLWRDGGPIIGIQLENELTNNASHILTLKRIAQEIGFDVPLYTMTGWGPAQVPASGVIPVFGGYPDAFWDRQVDTWSTPSAKHYFFTSIRDDNTIGADLNAKREVGELSHLANFPYGTCEIGGGMQVSYHRRPLIHPDDVAALAQVKIGNGSNLQGYYMYHGGSNPVGTLSTLQESQATHYPNDLPVIDYDFQAPLGEYGQIRGSFHKLRLLHTFLHHYGKELATYPPSYPEHQPASLEDLNTLRWAVRSNGKKGFLFINDYQRVDSLPDHPDTQFQVVQENETLTIPSIPITIPGNSYAIWPINLDLSGAILKYATAQPVCSLIVDDQPAFVFAVDLGIPLEFVFDASSLDPTTQSDIVNSTSSTATIKFEDHSAEIPRSFSILTSAGTKVTFILLPRALALDLYKVRLNQLEHIILANGCILTDNSQIRWQAAGEDSAELSIFPAPPESFHAIGYSMEKSSESIFTHIHVPLKKIELPVSAELVIKTTNNRIVPIGPSGVALAPEETDFAGALEYNIVFSESKLPESVKEILLQIDYIGDSARMYLDHRLIDDDFYSGRTWEIGLFRFLPEILENGVVIKILPLQKNAPIYLPDSALPDFNSLDFIARLNSIRLETVRDITFTA